VGSTNCTRAPAGYYKPRALFSDTYYICGAGYYSLAGSSSCLSCPSSTEYGSTYCPPTRQPTSGPSETPTIIPTRLPTVLPSVSPTSPATPTSSPTPSPTVYCAPGAVRTLAQCSLSSPGNFLYHRVNQSLSFTYYVRCFSGYYGRSGESVYCSSSLRSGAATCQVALGKSRE
jgi:hypothetical protein